MHRLSDRIQKLWVLFIHLPVTWASSYEIKDLRFSVHEIPETQEFNCTIPMCALRLHCGLANYRCILPGIGRSRSHLYPISENITKYSRPSPCGHRQSYIAEPQPRGTHSMIVNNINNKHAHIHVHVCVLSMYTHTCNPTTTHTHT